MIDLKYHIYSLVAVFVALAIGLLVGIALGGGPLGRADAIKQQSQSIQRLNEQFKAYSDKLAQSKTDLRKAYSDIKDADVMVALELPALIRGSLQGKGVCVLQIGGQDELSDGIVKVMAKAGAAGTSWISFDIKTMINDPKKLQDAAKSVPLEFQTTDNTGTRPIWAAIGAAIVRGNAKSLEGLKNLGLINIHGPLPPANKVVLVGANDSDPEDAIEMVVKPLVQSLKNNQAQIVTAFSASTDAQAKSDDENLWLDLELPTVEHADYAMGHICLIEALLENKGRYGLGPSCQILPKRLLNR